MSPALAGEKEEEVLFCDSCCVVGVHQELLVKPAFFWFVPSSAYRRQLTVEPVNQIGAGPPSRLDQRSGSLAEKREDEAELLAILAQPLNLLSLTFMSLVSPHFSANPCTAHLQSHNSADQTRKNSIEPLITRDTYGTPWWEVKGFDI